ncbi:GNAT family N-acetyltransferase [Streptomyces sp. NPDC001407]|uniref:GNAT family N-acetyltransferase n=1 Tax=unclassified Streptomyces TaxID=2593676 RepID=UPI0033DADAC3
MGDVFLRRLSRWQSDQYREQLADVHAAAYGGAPGEAPRTRSRFQERLSEDSARPGFDLVIAENRGPVGCAYGYPLSRDSDRWHGFDGPVPADLAELTAAGRVFLVAELMVLPRHRRQGIGRRLHDRLLSGSGAGLAAILLSPADAHGDGAHAARLSWGWTAAGKLSPGGGPVLEVFVRALRR